MVTIAMDCGFYEPGDIESNYEKISASISLAKEHGCDMICFPEASLSGYSSKVRSPASDDIIQRIVASSNGIAVIFGAFEEDDGLFITQYVCEDGRLVGRYRKTHLGMNETPFTAGDSLPVFQLSSMTIGIQICWELHFPQITGTYRSKGADLVLNPFASGLPPERRMALWKKIVPTRADDNRIFYAACNCDGSSTICCGPNGDDISGEVIGGHLCKYDLDLSMIQRYRNDIETMSSIDYPRHFRPELYDFE